jgi:hypothetical protein
MAKLRNTRRKSNQRRSRRQRGGASSYVFDVERINESDFFTTVIDNHLPDLCTRETRGVSCAIGSLEPDNTSISKSVVQLGGRGASGSMDMCQFNLNPKTGAITFEPIGEPEEPSLGNLWAQTQADIAALLETYKVQVTANNESNSK